MEKNVNQNQNIKNDLVNTSDEINLYHLIQIISRRKKLIFYITFFSLASSFLYSLIAKPVWEGEFQIVLENKEGNNSFNSSQSPFVSNLFSEIISQTDDLATEVSILKSSSIMKPVFDYVKIKKYKSGINTSGWTYRAWLKSYLKINLQKGTSVLDISYRDNDKDIILPVLNKISNAYQEYSGRDRERSISQGISFLNNQLLKMRKQSNNSMRQLQKFSFDNGLGDYDGIPKIRAIKDSDISISQTMVDDSNLVGIKNQSNNFRNLESERYSTHFSKLARLEAELIEKSSKLKDNSKIIISLKQKIQSLKKSLSRPKEILLKHRELRRIAIRDEELLEKIENQLTSLELMKARQTNPWELISSPTILDEPVEPRKSRIIFFGTFAGLFLSLVSALIVDRRKGLIYTTDEFIDYFSSKPLISIPLNQKSTWENAINSIMKGHFMNTNEPILLIPLGERDNDLIYEFTKMFIKISNNNVTVSNDFNNLSLVNKRLLIAKPGSITKDQLLLLKDELNMQGFKKLEWVFLDPTLKV